MKNKKQNCRKLNNHDHEKERFFYESEEERGSREGCHCSIKDGIIIIINIIVINHHHDHCFPFTPVMKALLPNLRGC
tara:strand:+ start:1143 stop:1373 length:231 start_codon:yes stop_codon:yes gene_type:complete